MEMTTAAIARLVAGDLAGDGERIISGVASFADATGTDITFAAQASFLKQLDQATAGVVLVPRDIACATVPVIRVDHPQMAFAKIIAAFHPPSRLSTGIHPRAVIGDDFSCGKDLAVGAGAVIGDRVTVGDRVQIHPNVVIGDQVVMGDDVILHPNVTILERCVIGHRVIIQAGTVVGSDGYGYASDAGGHHKIPQIGIVRIDDDVEIGANNCIDRGALGSTHLRAGVKTDNLVHIAHNVVVGENALLVAQVGIAGSVTIGKNAILAGQAGIAGHLTIGEGVIIGSQAGIGQSVADGEILSGSPGIPHRLWLRVQRAMTKLPELLKQVASIEKRLVQVERESHGSDA